MPANSNHRILYPVQQVGLKADGDGGSFTEIIGGQSVGMTTNFNLQQIFTLGKLSIYENVEQIPDVEVSLNKVLDGNPLIYCLATTTASEPTLLSRGNEKCIFALSIFDETQEASSGTPQSTVQCSGQFISSVSYTFSVDGAFTEDASMVGNDKVWLNDPKPTNPNIIVPSFVGAFDGTESPVTHVNFKEHLLLEYDPTNGLDTNNMVADSDATILPPEIWGISDSGTNEQSNGVDFDAHLQSITVSCDFGRENLDELGRKAPYHRTTTPPIEVTCEVSVIATSGDMISAIEEGIYKTGSDPCELGGNLKDRTIRIATCEGTRIYLGLKNRLSSVNYSGGDAGGGNVVCSYTFITYNDFTVMHQFDPNTNFTWAGRDTYLRDV